MPVVEWDIIKRKLEAEITICGWKKNHRIQEDKFINKQNELNHFVMSTY